MDKGTIFISLVIPAYNESKTIANAIDKVLLYFTKKDYLFEIIVVDDGSIDDTGYLVTNLSKKWPSIRLITHTHNIGKGFSVKNGILAARGDYILFSDADLSVPIEELDKIMAYFSQGYDMVIGSRALQESSIILRQSWFRQGMGRIFNLLVRLLGLASIRDTQCGFKCFSKNAAQKIFNLQRLNSFCFDVEILHIAKFLKYKIKEVPIIWINRVDSRVSIIKDSLLMLFDLLKIRLNILLGFYNAA
ncbi:MAG: glycosyltransferase family 2 protein [Candidatus Omnitrophica bacterium]|nr:glycosyltransferase family 2 protein [Candidatus Omnitrophota bacterium]